MAKTDKEKQEQIRELFNRVQEGVKNVYESEQYKKYLSAMAKFHQYSPRNTLLILLQKPEATFVAGYVAWQKHHHRQVKKGEHGIQIVGYAPKMVKTEQQKLDDTGKPVIGTDGKPVMETVTQQIPYFVPVYVYDISQTEGEPLPKLVNELDGSVIGYANLMTALQEVSPFTIEFEPMTDDTKGYCQPMERRIAIKEGMSQVQTIKTAIHEITHADLHTPDLRRTAGRTIDRATEEVEAESIAFILCAHYDIDTGDYSFPYLAHWSSGKELKELQDSLDRIQQQAAEMIEKIDTRLEELTKEQERAQGIEQVSPEAIHSLIAAHEANEERTYSRVYAQDGDKWIAVDDSTHDCWVEEFPTREQAVNWLNQEFEVQDKDNVRDSIQLYDTLKEQFSLSPEQYPDTAITLMDMEKYGFIPPEAGSVLPLEFTKARELFENRLPVMLLYSDGTSKPVYNEKQLFQHAENNGIFGIKTLTWIDHLRETNFEDQAHRLAERIDILIDYIPTLRNFYPYSITDNQSRLDAISRRISNYEIKNNRDWLLQRLPVTPDDHTKCYHAYNAIMADIKTLQQEKLAFEVGRNGGEPVVTVLFSENNDLSRGQSFPLHVANDFFKELDNRVRAGRDNPDVGVYDKTSFLVKYAINGEYHTYEGRQDFGDGDGTIIDHMRAFHEYTLSPEMANTYINAGYPELVEHAQYALETIIPYLEQHDLLGRLEDVSKNIVTELTANGNFTSLDLKAENILNYHEAVLAAIQQARESLNTGKEFKGFPKREDYSLSSNIQDDHDTIKNLYEKHIQQEIKDEAAAYGVTVDHYAAANWDAPVNRNFVIYQMIDDESTRGLRFESLENLKDLAGNQIQPDISMYNKVYSGKMPEGATLSTIFQTFNVNHPAEFKGRSLSMSDIIAVQHKGTWTANYVDSTGFVSLPDFAAQISGEDQEERRRYNATLDSVKFDNDIDLDMEKTQEQLGFREPEQSSDKIPMAERFAAAKAKADRRNTEQAAAQKEKEQEREV